MTPAKTEAKAIHFLRRKGTVRENEEFDAKPTKQAKLQYLWRMGYLAFSEPGSLTTGAAYQWRKQTRSFKGINK